MADLVKENMKKPKIAVLGIMQELYLPIFPGIKERQEAYAKEVLDALSGSADFTFPGAAVNRQDIETYMAEFNSGDYDGLLIIMLTYGASFLSYAALLKNRLPVLLVNIQPERTVRKDWDMADLTYNQGIHGCQDTGNALMWTDSQYAVASGDWRSDAFKQRVADWAVVVKVINMMKRTRIAGFGQMPGMGDIQANPAAVMSTFGIQVDQAGIGLIYKRMQEVSEAEVDACVEENGRNFEIDPRLSEENHRYAARYQAAIEGFLEEHNYRGVSVYFNAPADDGRFKQLPLLAASNLMAKGYGYGGEGDISSTTLVTIGQLLAPDATFIEMYAMDFDRDSLLMSHMGEGNWKIARKDRPVKLIDRPLGIGGLENPPTAVFSAEPGPATLVTLISLPSGGFRLILSKGEILDTEVMDNVEMPYYHYKPDSGIEACMDGWLTNGGSHHQCLHLGDLVEKWKLFCRLTSVEFVRV